MSTYAVVGWIRSTWPESSEGSEYASVRTICLPVWSCVKTVKSALKSSFALLTGTENESHSPAGEMDFVVMLFFKKKELTVDKVSDVGLTNSST